MMNEQKEFEIFLLLHFGCLDTFVSIHQKKKAFGQNFKKAVLIVPRLSTKNVKSYPSPTHDFQSLNKELRHVTWEGARSGKQIKSKPSISQLLKM